MGRGAHGRLARLAALGGILLACAAAPPKPVETVAAEPEEAQERDPPCGGHEPPQPASPEEIRTQPEAEIERLAAACGAAAEAAGRHGEDLVARCNQ